MWAGSPAKAASGLAMCCGWNEYISNAAVTGEIGSASCGPLCEKSPVPAHRKVIKCLLPRHSAPGFCVNAYAAIPACQTIHIQQIAGYYSHATSTINCISSREYKRRSCKDRLFSLRCSAQRRRHAFTPSPINRLQTRHPLVSIGIKQ